MPMILVPLLLTLALNPAPLAGPAPGTSSAKSAWESCLQTVAQVESLGTKSEAAIAVNALAACSADRDRYIKSLIRDANAKPQNGQTAVGQAQRQVATDQRDLTIRLIAFIRRARRA
ncbi:hypothetical protein U1737_03765 [Sphingomonas sp. LB3N6]|uniref:hypothetical protein n=1 Tax=Sphingomonas fucosidasi TaxID=3096164 RepID=UPI002FCBCCA0